MKVTTKRKSRMGVQTLGATEFKARCLELMDEVERSGVPLTVTKRGRPVVRVIPVDEQKPRLFGAGKGLVIYMGDVISPTGEPWDAER